jgi:hypothetical protein
MVMVPSVGHIEASIVLSPTFKAPANAGIVRSGTRKRANTALFRAFSSVGTLAVPMFGRMRAWYS